jgi:hypothetical protein
MAPGKVGCACTVSGVPPPGVTLAQHHVRATSGRRGSNPRPSAWEADALPTELLPRTFAGGDQSAGGACRSQLSYSRGAKVQSHRSELNRRPLDYESSALPLSYGGAPSQLDKSRATLPLPCTSATPGGGAPIIDTCARPRQHPQPKQKFDFDFDFDFKNWLEELKSLAFWNGAEGSRTPDLCSAIAALSQLSYSPLIIEPQTALDGRDRTRTCDLYDVNVAL